MKVVSVRLGHTHIVFSKNRGFAAVFGKDDVSARTAASPRFWARVSRTANWKEKRSNVRLRRGLKRFSVCLLVSIATAVYTGHQLPSQGKSRDLKVSPSTLGGTDVKVFPVFLRLSHQEDDE